MAFIIAISCNHPLFAQGTIDATAQSVGAVLDYGLAGQANSFSPLSGIPNCCQDYDEFAGHSFGAGLQYYYPLQSNWSVRFRIGYYISNLELRSVEIEQINVGGELFVGQFEHIFKGNFSNYFAQIAAGYNILDNMTVLIGGKLMLNSTIDYEQYEKIIRPADRGVFVDTGTRTRNEFSGETGTLNKVIPVVTIGAFYSLPLNKNETVILSPEIAFERMLNSLAINSDWEMYSFQFGISVSVVIGGF